MCGRGFTYSRAMLTMIMSDGKLFSTFPCVSEPNVRYPDSAMTRHATIETPVEKWVTFAKRSIVGVCSEP